MAASSVSRSFAASIRSTNSIISSTAAFCTTCCGIWWRPRASIGSPRIEWRVIARLIMTLTAEGAKRTWSTGAGRIGMVRCCLAYAAAIVVYSAAAPYSFAQAEPRAVIELFTSQGCSSCPPADQLLGELADDPSLVSVSVPVDYWDYLGWKDTLADPRNTARQKAYAHARGDGQVYTPQVVVNGSLHALGSDKAAIELAIAASRKNGAMSLLPTLALTDGRLNVSVPDAADLHTGAEVWLFGLRKTAIVAIGRGENKGRAITYHNVVRRWVKLGDWTGKANSWSIPVQTLKGTNIDEAAVLVQSGTVEKPKTILGATLAAIH